MRVIPAIDIKDGRCVRLLKGRFDEVTEYPVTPVELAGRYQAAGARWIHCVDLDGARGEVPVNLKHIGEIVAAVTGIVQAGGGVRDERAIVRLLDVGVDWVVIGSVAVEKPARACRWIETIGSGRLVLALDVKLDETDGTPYVVYRGWTQESRTTLWEALERFADSGLRHVLCTDVSRDGAMTGPALDLYEECVERHPRIAFQASGGVRHAEDLKALSATGVAGAIVGKALLDGCIEDEELEPYLRSA